MGKETTSKNIKPEVAMRDSSSQKSVQQRGNGTYKPPLVRTMKFKGRCEDMGEYVYNCIGSKQSQAESYAKTSQELIMYVGKT